jgi:hypothetical protein
VYIVSEDIEIEVKQYRGDEYQPFKEMLKCRWEISKISSIKVKLPVLGVFAAHDIENEAIRLAVYMASVFLKSDEVNKHYQGKKVSSIFNLRIVNNLTYEIEPMISTREMVANGDYFVYFDINCKEND